MFSETPVQLQCIWKFGLYMSTYICGTYTDTMQPRITCHNVMTLHNVLQFTNITYLQVRDGKNMQLKKYLQVTNNRRTFYS